MADPNRSSLRPPLAAMTRRGALFLIAASALPAWAGVRKGAKNWAARRADPAYATRADAMRFADTLAAREGLPRPWMRQTIGQARLRADVVRLMQPAPAGTSKNWQAYRDRFVGPQRIGAGLDFWRTQAGLLARAQKQYGVPAEIVVGILGVETFYGRQMGSFRVLDALATLAFDFPAAHPRARERAEFFQRELGYFLRLQRQAGTDPLAVLGSYAGAVGMPQFMPSSWAQMAVDYDGDGRIDLAGAPDAIGSVAHYLHAYGWQPGLPTHYPVRLDAQADMDALLAPDILPTFSPARFAALGAHVEHDGEDSVESRSASPLALVELENGGQAPDYVAGTENFYVITRYNWSSYYALAVIELGRAVKAAAATTS